MSYIQHRRASSLIREWCANYDHGNCLLLDDGTPMPCPQINSASLKCSYFRDAVLPGDKLLHAQIMGESGVKGCAICGKPFRAVSPRAKYCERCGKDVRRNQAKERMRKQRGA